MVTQAEREKLQREVDAARLECIGLKRKLAKTHSGTPAYEQALREWGIALGRRNILESLQEGPYGPLKEQA